MKQGISNRVARLIVLTTFFLGACGGQKKENEERERNILKFSKDIMGEQEYNKIYQLASDSLNKWSSEKLPAYQSIWSFDYQLDSVLCFNSNKDRMVTAILSRHNRSDCETDDVHYFYGAKIKGKWYFFRGGGTMIILREHYQSDIHIPVSFEKLHELAMEEMLRGYIKKNSIGEWKINDHFFTHHFEGPNWGDFKHQTHQDTVTYGKRFTNKKAYFDAIHIYVSTGKWPSEREIGIEAFSCP